MSVRRYFCNRLLGFSGIVLSMYPLFSAGWRYFFLKESLCLNFSWLRNSPEDKGPLRNAWRKLIRVSSDWVADWVADEGRNPVASGCLDTAIDSPSGTISRTRMPISTIWGSGKPSSSASLNIRRTPLPHCSKNYATRKDRA